MEDEGFSFGWNTLREEIYSMDYLQWYWLITRLLISYTDEDAYAFPHSESQPSQEEEEEEELEQQSLCSPDCSYKKVASCSQLQRNRRIFR